MSSDTQLRVGIISTRISGTDGVSLEIGKWTTILERLGCECFYICGKSDRPPDRTFLIELADFAHPEIQAVDKEAFGRRTRTREFSERVRALATPIKDQLYESLAKFKLDLLVVQNALAIPINIPLGAAIVEVLLETGLPCIAHHHDFYWERQRYLVSAVDDYLRAAFPPPLAGIDHVVINSMAGEEFSRRTGLAFHVIPNVMDFARPPAAPDEYAADFRQSIGLSEDDILILQPTRVVERKGIEHTIELVRRLDDPRCKIVVSHNGRDEGTGYVRRIEEYANLLNVELIHADSIVSSQRGTTEDGRKIYSIWDVYPHADLVAYPSTYEGFGNAFLEAVYFNKPIFCNRYAIYQTDIEPYGFYAVEMDGFLTDAVVAEVRRALNDASYCDSKVRRNYEIGCQYFSYERLERELRSLLEKPRLGPCAIDS
jgi:glycosyltransferase involved in cell wall biosynthesis